jgi:hypothetical protein
MPGGHVGSVGVPDGGLELSIQVMFSNNLGVGAASRMFASTSHSWGPKSSTPARVFDLELPLVRRSG